MPKAQSRGSEAAELRRKSEARLSARKPRPLSAMDADPLRLLHELEVHRVELEMQNEELRATRKELEATVSRYRELFDFAPVGYVILTRDGLIQDSNLAIARLVGVERDRLVGKRFVQFVAPAQRQAFAAFLQDAVVAGGGAAAAICELALELPLSVTVRLSGVPLRESFEELLVGVEDLTAQKKAEATLRIESQRKDEFVATLSHELRNPLAAIRSGVYVITRAEPGTEESRKSHQVLDRQVGHLTRMVDDLLDISRVMRGKLGLSREQLELGELVRHTIDDNRGMFEAAGIEVTCRFSSEPLWVDADPTRIVQVIGNLLANAAKFTPRGGRVEVTVQSEPRGTVAVAVRDSGAGIAAEAHQSIFEPFWQGPQPLDRPRGGLGLGLAMVKGLVELHGGSVSVESGGPGLGSVFAFRLPLLPEVPRRRSDPPKRRYRILVIEDNADSADSLRDALSLDGHDVEVAYDGESGLIRARASRPDVVLCDLGLPKMDGYDVARNVRSDSVIKDLPMIALSGYALPEDQQRAIEAGFDLHVSKPATVEKLKDLLKSIA